MSEIALKNSILDGVAVDYKSTIIGMLALNKISL
jgi:hypothetical protein